MATSAPPPHIFDHALRAQVLNHAVKKAACCRRVSSRLTVPYRWW